MRIIWNQYIIGSEKLIIEQDIQKDDFYFRVIDLKTSKCTYESEAIGHVIPCRAKGFEYMRVQRS